MIFHMDVVTCFMSSILHKDVHVVMPGWDARARCWLAATGEPGAGKSLCMDPLRDILVDVLRECAELAPGSASDRFHMQQGTTHAVAFGRLRNTEGYIQPHCVRHNFRNTLQVESKMREESISHMHARWEIDISFAISHRICLVQFVKLLCALRFLPTIELFVLLGVARLPDQLQEGVGKRKLRQLFGARMHAAGSRQLTS